MRIAVVAAVVASSIVQSPDAFSPSSSIIHGPTTRSIASASSSLLTRFAEEDPATDAVDAASDAVATVEEAAEAVPDTLETVEKFGRGSAKVRKIQFPAKFPAPTLLTDKCRISSWHPAILMCSLCSHPETNRNGTERNHRRSAASERGVRRLPRRKRPRFLWRRKRSSTRDLRQLRKLSFLPFPSLP